MKLTQSQRLLAYLREHPGASSLEITKALLIVNVTGRISDLRRDLREHDEDIAVSRDPEGVFRYRIVRLVKAEPEQLRWTAA